MLVTYVIVNWSLILEILVGDSSYVSHREEMVSSATPFLRLLEPLPEQRTTRIVLT